MDGITAKDFYEADRPSPLRVMREMCVHCIRGCGLTVRCLHSIAVLAFPEGAITPASALPAGWLDSPACCVLSAVERRVDSCLRSFRGRLSESVKAVEPSMRERGCHSSRSDLEPHRLTKYIFSSPRPRSARIASVGHSPLIRGAGQGGRLRRKPAPPAARALNQRSFDNKRNQMTYQSERPRQRSGWYQPIIRLALPL